MKFAKLYLFFFIFIFTSVFAGIPHNRFIEIFGGEKGFDDLLKVELDMTQVTSGNMRGSIVLGKGFVALKIRNHITNNIEIVYFIYNNDTKSWEFNSGATNLNFGSSSDLENFIAEVKKLIAGDIIDNYQLARFEFWNPLRMMGPMYWGYMPAMFSGCGGYPYVYFFPGVLSPHNFHHFPVVHQPASNTGVGTFAGAFSSNNMDDIGIDEDGFDEPEVGGSGVVGTGGDEAEEKESEGGAGLFEFNSNNDESLAGELEDEGPGVVGNVDDEVEGDKEEEKKADEESPHGAEKGELLKSNSSSGGASADGKRWGGLGLFFRHPVGDGSGKFSYGQNN